MAGILRREGLRSRCWTNAPGERYRPHSHDHGKVLYCLAGSITFHIAGHRVPISPGDRLEISPDTIHSADVGPDGVVCIEAIRPKQAGPGSAPSKEFAIQVPARSE